MPEQLADRIAGYRYKETLPTTFKAKDIQSISQALKVTNVTPEELLNRILLEGRADAGANSIDLKNKKSVETYDNLTEQNFSDFAARFAVLVNEKQAIAKRLNITFDEAWNGTGKSDLGKTGKDYAARAAQMSGAAKDPRNANLLDFITRAASDNLTTKEKLAKDLNDYSGKPNYLKQVFGEGPFQTNPLIHQVSWSLMDGDKLTPSDTLSAAVTKKALIAQSKEISADKILQLKSGQQVTYFDVVRLLEDNLKNKIGVKSELEAKYKDINPTLAGIIDSTAVEVLQSLGIKENK